MHKNLVLPAILACPFALSSAFAGLPTASLTTPADFRIVAGSVSNPLTYTLSDTGSADQDLDFSINQYILGTNAAKEYGSFVSLTQGDPAVVTPLSGFSHTGYTLGSGGSASLSVQPDTSGLVAGNIVNLGVQMNGAGWDNPVTSNTSINVVENRLLTGSLTLNSGRHILGQIPGGTLALSGGALSGTEGTNITVNSGGFAQYSNGVRLTSATSHTFDGAGQTHNLQVGYYGSAGNYSHNITLSGSNGANNYTDASGVARSDFGGFWRTETEYGAVIGGGTETRVTGQVLTTNQLFKGSSVTSPTGSTNFIERTSNFVETTQPGSPATTLNNGLLATSRAAGVTVNERQGALITGESIQGSNLNLSGVSVDVSGTALNNRNISTGYVNLGRKMVSGGTEAVSRTDNFLLTSGGSDSTSTRLHLDDFTASGGGVTAVFDNGGTGQDFTGVSGQQASVDVTANFTADRTALGAHFQTVSSGAGKIHTLENGGAGLTGESVQGGVSIGYVWQNVAENQITAKDQHVFVYENDNISGRSLSSRGISTLSTSHYTDIGVDSNFSISGSNAVVGSDVKETIAMNKANGRVSGEGLDGELVTASGSFSVTAQTIGRAEASAERAGEVLASGETVSITNTNRGLATARQADLRVTPVSYEGHDRWTVNYTGNAILSAGESASLTTAFDDSGLPTVAEGELGKAYRSIITFELADQYDIYSNLGAFGLASDSVAGGNDFSGVLRGGNSEQVSWIMERTVQQTATTGSSVLTGGSDLGATGLNLTNTGENSSAGFAATTAAILDSDTLGGDTTVTMTYTKTDDASTQRVLGSKGSTTEFATDVLNLDGLDGVKHVIELTYDENALNTDEKFVQLVWLTSFDADPETEGVQAEDIWVNAILGNSDVTALDIIGETVTTAEGTVALQTYLDSKRFEGSYAEYLDSIDSTDPELSAWGINVDNNTVWAVVDHNSSFAGAVPEPSTLLMFGLGGFVALIRRRR